jgi:nucleotide-binding universal stress UspA family protein
MKILLAIDDSKFSQAATQAVIDQFSPQGTEVKVLNVVDLAIPIPTSYAGVFREESLKHGQETVQRAASLLSKAGFKAQASIEEGDPKSVIIDHARESKTDLIVMGSHGRKGLTHFLTGSVAEGVSRHAPCSVEVVRISKN